MSNQETQEFGRFTNVFRLVAPIPFVPRIGRVEQFPRSCPHELNGYGMAMERHVMTIFYAPASPILDCAMHLLFVSPLSSKRIV